LIDYFTNDKYKVLKCMSERQISVLGIQVVKLSQQEIADTLHFTKTKVNSIISDLKIDGYLLQQSPRGKYVLTEKALEELSAIDNKEVSQ